MKTLEQQRRLWRRATAAIAIAGLAALAVPAVSWAGGPGPFADVDVDHPFVNEISEVANAGVANGFPDGTYRPSQPVTRQAMAAFLSRAGSSVAQVSGTSLSNITSNSYNNARAIAVDVPGTAETEQRVHVSGLVTLQDADPSGCAPCTIALQITGTGSEGSSTERFYTIEPTNFSDTYDTLQIEHVFTVPGGIHTFQVRARWAFGSGTVDVAIGNATAIATVIPFSASPLV